MSHQHHCVILGETGKGKSSFLKALFKNYEIDKDIPTNKGGKRCTTKITPYKLDIGDEQFFFYDTPGLNDNKLDKQTKEALRQQATSTKNRIKALLICLHIDDDRFTTSIEEMILEFMNCFPLKDFWEHVLVIRTHVITKEQEEYGDLETSVIENLGTFMKEKSINYPNKMNEREFFFNSVLGKKSNPKVNVGEEIKGKFEKVIEKIKKLDPFFEKIKFLREEQKEEGNFIVTYKIYEYTDFGGTNRFEKPVEKEREFKIKQVGKTGPHRDRRYLGTRTDCWGNESSVYQDYKYYIDVNGKKCDFYDVGDEYEE